MSGTSTPRTGSPSRRHQDSEYEAVVKRYYLQLTKGCGRVSCTNKFCCSSPNGLKLKESEAAVYSINLAATPKRYFCEIDVRDLEAAKEEEDRYKEGENPHHRRTFSSELMRQLASVREPQASGLQILTRKKRESPKKGYIYSRIYRDPDLPDDEYEPTCVVLDIDTFNDMWANCEKSQDFSALVTFVKDVFSHVDALNGSFLKKQKRVIDLRMSSGSKIVDDVNFHYGMISHDQVPVIFNKITLVPELEAALSSALESAVSELMTKAKQFTTGQQLRIFQFLFSCPTLVNKHYTHNVYTLKKLAKSFLLLPDTSQRMVVLTIARLEPARFVFVLKILHACIELHLEKGHDGIDNAVLYACEILHQLYVENEEKHIVSYTAFYLEGIEKRMKLKHDYAAWRAAKAARKSSVIGLFDYPFLFSASLKSRIFHVESFLEMNAKLEDAVALAAFNDIVNENAKNAKLREIKVAPPSHLILRVSRDKIVEDTMRELSNKVRDLKKPIKVIFIGEEGIDAGGVQKEFFQLVVEALFSTEVGIWEYKEEQRVFWFTHDVSEEALQLLRFVGIVVGMAIFNGIILDVHFPQLMYKKLLGNKLNLADLELFDGELYRSLHELLDFEGDVEGVFCRDFQASYTQKDGTVKNVELKADGANIPVTSANKQEYVDRYVEWILTESVKAQFDAFLNGFKITCEGRAIRMCRQEELEQLVCGSPDIPLEQLEDVATYVDYERNDQYMTWFWELVYAMSINEKKKLLQFVTGSDKIPVTGLKSLTFKIQKNGSDSDRLPTSHTCFGVMLLPAYSSKEKMSRMLDLAVGNSQGFGLR